MNNKYDKTAGKVRKAMNRMGIDDYISSMAEDYTKRLLEAKYDRLSQTALFQKLKRMDQRERLMVEFAFYSFNAFLKHGISDPAPVSRTSDCW